MRDKLHALVEDLTYEKTMSRHSDTVDVCTQTLRRLNDILASEPPAVSVKAGWVCKDRVGLWWCEHEPELLADGKWITIGSLYLSKRVFTDPWPDKTNGGPECIMEVK